jgi:uncharacterized protein YjiS (DUF1127 family)
MAIDTHLDLRQSRFGDIPALFRNFRQAFQRRQVETELDGLSDRFLRDIGVERGEISQRVEREITRNALADLGWSGRSRRR